MRSVAADLATAEGRQAVIGFAEGQGVDLLINNAGVGYLGPVTDNPPERESEMAQLNIVAPVEITRALLPGMLKRAEGGSRGGIIFVASAAAFMPIPLFATYAASKAFLLHYAEALAEELSDTPVDVLALCPGATKTRFFERANITRFDRLHQMHGADRVAQEGLQALGRRVVHVVGPTNYLATAAARFLPRRFRRRCRPNGRCGGGSNHPVLLTKHLSIS